MIKFIIFNCLQHINIIHFRSKKTFTMSMYTNIKFLWTENVK